MKKIFKLLLLSLPLLGEGCSSPVDSQKESVERTLNTYVRQFLFEKDSTLTLDSLRIIKIDSVSSKDLILMKHDKAYDTFVYLSEIFKADADIYILKTKQYRTLAALNDDVNYLKILLEGINDGKKELDAQRERITQLRTRMDILEQSATKADSTNFLLLKPIFKICYSDKKLKQDCRQGGEILITQDFRVTEDY